MAHTNLNAQEIKRLNSVVQFSTFSVFKIKPGVLGNRAEAAADLQDFIDSYADAELEIRGVYDLSALRAEADLMIWWHAEKMQDLQEAYRRFLKDTQIGQASEPVWSNTSLHRPSEFNKAHLPSFIMGEEPGAWICVYPFVRSYDWYTMDRAERSRLLREHGRAAQGFDEVRANTVPAFALGDYEWLLAFESPTLERIVELMHEMRYTEARHHVREETPFFTGRRLNGSKEELANFVESLA